MRFVWISAGIFLGMLIAARLADVLYPGEWQTVEATVLSTEIQRTRPGTPQWSLMANVRYEVAGEHYEHRNLEVFRDPLFDVTDATMLGWPVGRTFLLYYNVSDPHEVSIYEDGGKEAVIVVSALSVPVICALVFFVVALARTRVRSRTTDFGKPPATGKRD